MFTPEQQQQIAETLATRYSAAEQEIVAALLRAHAMGDGQLAALLRAARAWFAELEALSVRWVDSAVPSLFRAGVQTVDAGIPRAELRRLLAASSTRQRQIAAALQAAQRLRAEQAADRFVELLRSADSTIARTIRAHQDALVHGTLRGERIPLRTAQDVMQAASKGRLIAWTGADDRQYGLTARARSISTQEVRGAIDDGFEVRCRSYGIDVAEVTSHGNPCPLCGPWEGELLSLFGETPGYPTLAEARGAGLQHHNCYHGLHRVRISPEARSADDYDATIAAVADRRAAAEEQRRQYEAQAERDRERYREEAAATNEGRVLGEAGG